MENDVYKIKNHRVITARYYGPTNYRGSRVVLSEENHRAKEKVVLSYDYEIGSIGQQAYNYLKEKGFNIKGRACLKDRDLFFVDNWKPNWIDLK